MQDTNCKEEQGNERRTAFAQEKTCLSRAVILLIKPKYFEGVQVLGFFGNSNVRVDRVQMRLTCPGCLGLQQAQ